ncbi:hypothetical protein IQE94_01510 [Synechocystis sp. PCC 7339]|uniref:hypothetical protein n=1 Tax=Synechocystis sp. PCC 7339 TaxID=2782213 RepID=UPI001CBCAE5E|nr:hypothetical protein [Synechocystis sp. PCC 7339]UAJ73056.1 hypothetical protein IQE94_01510 [Synechocystis sp. PCC 7339]
MMDQLSFSSMSGNFKKIFRNCALIVVSISGIIYLQSLNLTGKAQPTASQDYAVNLEDERLKLTALGKAPSLGFNNIIADWLYLQFIQYFGDNEAREMSGYGLVVDYFEQIIYKDPLFTNAIARLDVATSLFAGEPQASVNFLSSALHKQPNKFKSLIPPYYLWRAKGNNELLFLGDTEAAKESYINSIKSAQSYDTEDSKHIAEISKSSIKFLQTNPDSKFARISAWVNVLSNNPDPKTVKKVTEEIRALGGKVEVLASGAIQVKLPEKDN